MLGCFASVAGRCFVICGVFFRLAPRASYSEIIPIVCAAVFERDNVLDYPIVFRPECPSAFPATAMAFNKQLYDFSFRKPDARIVVPGGTDHRRSMSNPSIGVSSLRSTRRSIWAFRLNKFQQCLNVHHPLRLSLRRLPSSEPLKIRSLNL